MASAAPDPSNATTTTATNNAAPPPPPPSVRNDTNNHGTSDTKTSSSSAVDPSTGSYRPPQHEENRELVSSRTHIATTTTMTMQTAPQSHKIQDRTNSLHHNFMRVLWAVGDTVDGLKPYTEATIATAHTALLATLGDVDPPCNEHDGKRMSQLLKCSHCKPWAEALVQLVREAGQNPKKKNWTAANLTPSTWPHPTLGPFAIAKAFVKARLTHDASIANADATCLLNILLHYPSVSQHLSPTTRTNLEALQTVRNEGIGHWHTPELSSNDCQRCLGVCHDVLKAGPWAEGSYKEGAQRAVDQVLAGHNGAVELLPQLEQLRRHFVPQEEPLTWLSQAAQSHRVLALCGLGGIGKSSTALAWAWKQVFEGAFPGQFGVLWASAAAASGGIDGALATVLQARLGIVLSPSEATNSVVVRQRLQGWAMARKTPWLLVLDNVEPGCKERGLLGLLGDHGVALLTTRASPGALHRDMDVVREAALRLECLSPEDGYKLMMARFGGKPSSWPASEEAAVRELAGKGGLGGLPLAMEQAAAMVGSVLGKTFAWFLDEFKKAEAGKVFPGDDGGAAALARTLAAAVTGCGLAGVAGLVDQLVAECESLDDVQWLRPEDVVWGAAGSDGTPCRPSVVQRRRWEALQKACKEHSMSARHEHTMETVWATQLSVLPKYCTELLQGAACFAPDHIPVSLFVVALRAWVEAEASGRWWLKVFAGGSALVAEVKKRLGDGGGGDVAAAVNAVVEAALQWLEDVSLVHRGVWMSAVDIHPLFGSEVFNAHSGDSGGTTGASGGAGSGAGAGGTMSAASDADTPRPWLSMHRLVQGAVLGDSLDTGGVVALHMMAAASFMLSIGRVSVERVLNGEAPVASSDDMELTAWLVAHDHVTSAARAVFTPSMTRPAADCGDGDASHAAPAMVDCVASLSPLVPKLGLFRAADAWCEVLQLGLQRQAAAGDGNSSDVALGLNNLALLYSQLA